MLLKAIEVERVTKSVEEELEVRVYLSQLQHW